jgi:hypothetical protein
MLDVGTLEVLIQTCRTSHESVRPSVRLGAWIFRKMRFSRKRKQFEWLCLLGWPPCNQTTPQIIQRNVLTLILGFNSDLATRLSCSHHTTIWQYPVALYRSDFMFRFCRLYATWLMFALLFFSYKSRYLFRSMSLWSSDQCSWLRTQRPRVRIPRLPDILSSSGSGTGSTQPREHKWGATWKKN